MNSDLIDGLVGIKKKFDSIFQDVPEEEQTDKEEFEPHYVPKEKPIFGKCMLQIRIEDEDAYENWKKYHGGQCRWDFVTTFPAIMRATYIFKDGTDVEMITKKIIQLLQMGFEVRCCDWKLAECKTLLERK